MGIGTVDLYVGASAVKAAAEAALPLPVLEVKSSLLLDAASGLHTVRWGRNSVTSCLFEDSFAPAHAYICICMRMYTYVYMYVSLLFQSPGPNKL